ncbi:MAG: hypothetical protein EBR73_17105 [Rhodobacteraceae bacterium]|nr:hypothetical protein [Paracoccaceae bacterium]
MVVEEQVHKYLQVLLVAQVVEELVVIGLLEPLKHQQVVLKTLVAVAVVHIKELIRLIQALVVAV